MEISTIVSAVTGAALALISVIVAHTLTSRERRQTQSLADQRLTYLEFVRAAEAAYGALRKICEPGRSYSDLDQASSDAVGSSDVYQARESVILLSREPIVALADRVLDGIRALEEAVRGGAKLDMVLYHDAYHPLAAAMWELRRTARREFGAGDLNPEHLGKADWDGAASCGFCQAAPSRRSAG